MNKNALTSMTVAELKALAKKKRISLPAGAKKADIVKVLVKAVPPASRSSKIKGSAAGRTVKSVRKVKTEKASAKKKPAGKTAGMKRSDAKKTRISVSTAGRTPLRRPLRRSDGVEEPLMAQERVADAKYYTGTAEQVQTAAPLDSLPHEYGSERMTLMARDPYMAFSYWELPQARLEKEKAWFGWDSKLCVRVYDITGVLFDGSNATAYFDQEVYDRVGSWYFDFGRPMHSFCADLGLLASNGRFLTMIRSNAVTMPRDGVSDVVDEEWMLVDEEFMKLYGGSGAVSGGLSSQQVQDLMHQRRMLGITSPGLFSKPKARKK